MKVYVQGLSALAHYRSSSAKLDIERCPKSVCELEDATSSRKHVMEAQIRRLGIGEPSPDHPLEVLVHSSKERSRSKAVSARVWKGPIAETAFRLVARDVYVSSPEFVFLQLATRLDLPELVALGMELCGSYRRNVVVPSLGTGETQLITEYNQQPLTTPKRLNGLLSSMKSSPGTSKALKALEYVLPNSASPMETALYLLLCLPRRLGGYALPKPELNPPIVLSKAGRRHTLRSKAKPDLYWRDAKLDLEFNSDEFHTEGSRADDSMRRKALERMHVEVIELTTAELFATSLFHATALRIALRLKKQLRPENEGDFILRRASLRKSLLVETPSDDTRSLPEGVDTAEAEAVEWSEDSSLWIDEAVEDEAWLDEAADADDVWAAEISEWNDPWDDDDLYVYGGATREQNPT